MADRGATLLAMELVPRITRAQSMDALSSMATIAGYKAVLLAAETLPRMFPMLNTAAGTVAAARVFIIGAGVAGLQAIATASALARESRPTTSAPAVKEQIQSLGARFVELPIDTAAAEGRAAMPKRRTSRSTGGSGRRWPKSVGATRCRHFDRGDPRQKSPILITGRDGQGDAARVGDRRSGGRARRQLRTHGRRPDRRSARRHDHRTDQSAGDRPVPRQPDVRQEPHDRARAPAQQAGRSAIDPADEITREILVTHKGDVIAPRLREMLGLAPLPAPVAAATA